MYVFNPFTEGCLASGPAFQPTQPQARLAGDLVNLPQFLCQPEDVVLVPERPSSAFLDSLKQAGFALPEFVEVKGTRLDPATVLGNRRLGALRPWAWGPDSVEFFRPLLTSVTDAARSANRRFNAGIARLFSKAASAEFLRRFLAQPCGEADAEGVRRPPGGTNVGREAGGAGAGGSGIWADEPWLCSLDAAGVVVETVDEALAAIAAIRARGHGRVVVKQDFGLAGQGALRLWEAGVSDVQRRWLTNAVTRGRQLVVEPWLARELDFSAQLEMEPEGLRLGGFTGLMTDHRGQYRGNWAESRHDRVVPSRVLELLAPPACLRRRRRALFQDLFVAIETELRRAEYLGPVGIDVFIYRAPDGRCRLKPIVEINPRYTMGRVTVELMRSVAPGRRGRLRLVNLAQARAEGASDFVEYARRLRERFPVRSAGDPAPRLSEGAVCLNDPARVQACLAVFEVTRPGE